MSIGKEISLITDRANGQDLQQQVMTLEGTNLKVELLPFGGFVGIVADYTNTVK